MTRGTVLILSCFAAAAALTERTTGAELRAQAETGAECDGTAALPESLLQELVDEKMGHLQRGEATTAPVPGSNLEILQLNVTPAPAPAPVTPTPPPTPKPWMTVQTFSCNDECLGDTGDAVKVSMCEAPQCQGCSSAQMDANCAQTWSCDWGAQFKGPCVADPVPSLNFDGIELTSLCPATGEAVNDFFKCARLCDAMADCKFIVFTKGGIKRNNGPDPVPGCYVLKERGRLDHIPEDPGMRSCRRVEKPVSPNKRLGEHVYKLQHNPRLRDLETETDERAEEFANKQDVETRKLLDFKDHYMRQEAQYGKDIVNHSAGNLRALENWTTTKYNDRLVRLRHWQANKDEMRRIQKTGLRDYLNVSRDTEAKYVRDVSRYHQWRRGLPSTEAILANWTNSNRDIEYPHAIQRMQAGINRRNMLKSRNLSLPYLLSKEVLNRVVAEVQAAKPTTSPTR